MSNVEILKDTNVFVDKDGEVYTTSLAVAEVFGKRHDNVMRDIENLDCSEEYRLLNFEETVYMRENPSKGRKIKTPMYRMTKDGFAFLVMGFTGKKAAAFKEAYIKAFNYLHDAYKDRRRLVDGHKKMSQTLQNTRGLVGKETKSYHYSNEADLLNRVVLGKPAAKLVEERGEGFRDTLTKEEVWLLNELETVNGVYIELGFTFDERKDRLHDLKTKRLAQLHALPPAIQAKRLTSGLL